MMRDREALRCAVEMIAETLRRGERTWTTR